MSPLLTLSKSISAGLISFFDAVPSGDRIRSRLHSVQALHHSVGLNFPLTKVANKKNYSQNRKDGQIDFFQI